MRSLNPGALHPGEFDDELHSHLATAFEVTLVKKDGSLGFTILKKEDGGLFVKEVIKEPAISSQPPIRHGDRILLVNGIDVSSMSHSGAIAFLRGLPDKVTLRLEPSLGDEDDESLNVVVGKKSKPLRHEAKMMLKDRPTNCDSLSRLKKLKSKSRLNLNNNEDEMNETSTDYVDSSLDETVVEQNAINAELSADCKSQSFNFENSPNGLASVGEISLELPKLMRQSLQCSLKKEQCDSMNNMSSGSEKEELGGDKLTSFAKWRGTTLSDNFDSIATRSRDEQDSGFGDHAGDCESNKVSSVPSTLEKPQRLSVFDRSELIPDDLIGSTTEIVLDRGWYGRLGISLIDDETGAEPNCCVVRAIFPQSVAAVDGRVKPGFKLLAVNGESMLDRPAKDVIEFLRKIKGKFRMEFYLPGLKESDL